MTVSSARYDELYNYCWMAEQIDYDLMGRADQLISRLSYFEATCRESRFRVGSDGLGSALRSYAAHALPIDQFVRVVGQAFQRADAAWGAAGAGGWWHVAHELTGELSDWWAWIAALAPVPALIAMSWRPGVGYVGKTIFSGTGLARDILGLSPRLSHISSANLLTHVGKNTRNVGPWFLVGATITSAEQWLKDIEEYRHDPLRMITAMTIDTEVIVATLGVSAIVAVKVAAVIVAGLGIGGTVGPLLVVGAVAVGIGLLAEKFLLEPFLESEFRRDVIDGVTDKEKQLLLFLDGRVDDLLGRGTQTALVVGSLAGSGLTGEEAAKVEPSPFKELIPKKVTSVEDVPLSVVRSVNTPDPPEKFTPYYRGASVTSKSNCTWYAATALATHTGGKIDLHAVHGDYRMGEASNWQAQAKNAKEDANHPLHGLVDDVNEKPAPGTIITFEPNKGGAGKVGHVAWVEQAHIIEQDGKKYWELIISEENYDGGGWSGATRIDTGDETILRWRRTVTYPVNEEDGSKVNADGVHFIHWNPDYKKE